jgi:hypothetical protein
VSRQYLRINRFGFAECDDMIEIARMADTPELTRVLSSIVHLVLSEEAGLFDSLTDSALANFAVPLGMSARMLSSGEYSAMELVSAACTVRYCAAPHMSEFPNDLAQLVSQLPR